MAHLLLSTFAMARPLLFFIISFSLLLSPISLDTSEQASISVRDSWHRLGLKVSFLQEYISESNCYESSIKFLGCVRTINFLLNQNQSNFKLVTQSWIQGMGLKAVGEKASNFILERDFGFFKIMKYIPPPEQFGKQTNIVEEYLKFHQIQKLKEMDWVENYETRREGNIVPFDKILAWVKTIVITRDNESEIVGNAFNSYLAAAEDAHAWIEPSEVFEFTRFKKEDNYFGSGVAFIKIQSKLAIKALLKEGPAAKSGLLLNDIILDINGHRTEAMTIEDIDRLLEEKKHDPLKMVIQRGDEIINFVVTPGVLSMKNVSSEVIGENRDPQKLGYIQIRSFMKEGACASIKEALLDFKRKNVSGIIIDLRNNGGGLINEAVCTAGLFIGTEKPIFDIQNFSTNQDTKLFSTEAKIIDLPMVTIINRNSASASEIFAGSLQDYGRSLILGERSFGKGTIQSVSPWTGHPGIHRADTVARFYLPGNNQTPPHTNQIYGILPDIEAYEIPHPNAKDKFALREADFSPLVLQNDDNYPVVPNINIQNYFEKCTAHYRQAKKTFPTAKDYPLLVAQNVLSCPFPTLSSPSVPIVLNRSHKTAHKIATF